MRPLSQLFFPIQYLEICHSLVVAKGGDFAQIINAVAVDIDQLRSPMSLIDGEQLLAVYAQTLSFCEADQPYVLQVLDYFPITAHGLMGVLALTAAKLEDALNGALEFFPVLMPAYKVQRQDSATSVNLYFEPACHFGDYDDFFAELIPLAICQIAPFLAAPLHKFHCYFRHSSAYDPELYLQKLGVVVTFNCPRIQLSFPIEWLSIPLVTQSASVYRQAQASLTDFRQKVITTESISEQVTALINKRMSNRQIINAEVVARSMYMSERTLARRLAQEGQTILRIKNQVRIEQAKKLLLDNKKKVSEIAQKVGFSNAENFARAFKTITGKTPRQFRDEH